MKTISILALCSVLFFITFAARAAQASASTEFEISALNDQLSSEAQDNVQLYVENIFASSPKNLRAWQLELKKNTIKALQAIGYYQPIIAITTSYDDQEYLAKIIIDQGPATTISTLNISLVGMAETDPQFSDLIHSEALKLGDRFNHGNYQSFKNAFNDIAVTKGYFKARWHTSTVKINPQLNQAQITLIFHSGDRFSFGQLIFQQQSPAQELILSMLPFAVNDPYHSELLAKYNTALSRSKYFSAIEVFPDLNKAVDSTVPIYINLIEKPANSVEVGAGASSNSGPRGRIKWTKPWINKYGHSITSELKLAKLEQSFAASYKVPIEDPNDNYATATLGWQNIDQNDTRSTLYSFQLHHNQLLDSAWKRDTFLKFEREDAIQGEQQLLTTNIIPGISYARTRLKGGFTPYWGDKQIMSLELGHQGWGSDANLIKFKLRSKWLRSYQTKHQFIAAADLAAILAKSIEDVPVSMRLFGGGDENLRAYKFESISPSKQDELTGGLYQANLSFEYSYLIAPKWRLATFIDAGTTTNNFSEALKTDVGFGVRWITPVGPIKVDFAFGLTSDDSNPDYDKPFRLSFSIGPPL